MFFWLDLITVLGHPFAPHEGSWLIIEPSIAMGLALLGAVYLYAIGPFRERRGWADRVDRRYVVYFMSGLLILFVSLQGPLHELGDYYLFSAHMVQHLLVTMIAPPLMLKGMPPWLIDRALARRGALPVARLLLSPLVAFFLFNAVFAVWHAPQFYQAALGRPEVHSLEHILFIGTAFLTWWPIFSSSSLLPPLNTPLQVVYLFGQVLIPTILGALITFAPTVLYPYYAAAPRMWGVSPLLDQQIAGLIMWLGGSVIVLYFLTFRFFRWLNLDADETMEASRV
jgi:cytochrome c oxidase assembly factor CtaG